MGGSKVTGWSVNYTWDFSKRIPENYYLYNYLSNGNETLHDYSPS